MVKWFNPTKGYGLSEPSSSGGKDVFVHMSLECRRLVSLPGQTIEYEEVVTGKTLVENMALR